MKLKLNAVLVEQIFERNKKKYMKFKVDGEKIRQLHDARKHFLNKPNVDDPLDGDILTVKVPFRYNRIMCNTGDKFIYDFQQDAPVIVEMTFCGTWEQGQSCGYAWKLDGLYTGGE